MLKLKILLTVVITSLIGFWVPLEPSHIMRNTLGDLALQHDRPELAQWFYRSTARQNSYRGRNNAAVLEYALDSFKLGMTDDENRAVVLRAQGEFFSLSEKLYAPAEYNNGMIHFYGCNQDQPCYEKAIRRLQYAADLGDPLAPLAYALKLSSHSSRPEARAEKKRLLRELADAGDPAAAYAYVFSSLEYEAGVPWAEREKLREHYYRIAAASGHPDAMYTVGIGTEADDKAYWLERAAKAGVPDAALSRAQLALEREEGIDVVIKWYRSAMSQVSSFNPKLVGSDMDAVRQRQRQRDVRRIHQHPTGLRLYNPGRGQWGRGVGDVGTSPYNAAYELGVIYLQGADGAPVDAMKAYEAFQIAARASIKDSGLIAAQMHLWRQPNIVNEQHNDERLGFESLRYINGRYDRHRPDWLTEELEDLFMAGRLRAWSEFDRALLMSELSTQRDKVLLRRLETDGRFRNALVLTRGSVILPEVEWDGAPIVVLLAHSGAHVTVPENGYAIYKIHPDATIVKASDSESPTISE